ncbi:MAG: hypothetical protein NVSMB3_07780 [Acidobacteriaceae bacterium]
MNSTALSDPAISDSLIPEPQLPEQQLPDSANPASATPGSQLPDSSVPGPNGAPEGSPSAPSPVPSHVAKHLISGTSALGFGIVIERGMGFLANILAARLGGVATFGAYSLAISTANNISTYAAGQIGSTAARFSGKYQHGSPGYTTLARALAIVSVVSAILGAVGLWFGAAPIAHLLGNLSLTGLLRWAAISAAGIILLECARGFFVGQRRLAALVLLSLIVGVGMVSLVPFAATLHSPIRMIVSQGAITLSAVALCLLLARPLGLFAPRTSVPALPLGPVLREVWSFGFVQLAGLVGANLAGWWLTTLVARADASLVQMSFFAVASQLRNLVVLAPGLPTESSYAIMADPGGEADKTPHHVMALCTYAATFASLLLASLGIIVMPWALSLLWGHSYSAAAVTAAVGLAIAVMHMGNAPASARLSIVSIRTTGVLNTVWALVVAGAASLFLLHGGTAATGMLIYLFAHILAAALVLLTLARKDSVPAGMTTLFLLSASTTLALVALAFFRASHPSSTAIVTLGMTALVALSLSTLFILGRRHRWLPAPAVIRRALHFLTSAVDRLLHRGRTYAS